MQALLYRDREHGIEYTSVSAPEPGPGEVVVDLRAAALNHRDVWITRGLYPGIREQVILGSDGVGDWQGQRYLINPNINWGDDERFPRKDYHILGMPTHGTFAEQVAVGRDRLLPAPAFLTDAEAAALPLGGLTAYRAVFTKGRVREGQTVLVTGIGGGVAQFAAQFAHAAGAEVFVTSGSEDKIARAVEMGMRGGAIYRRSTWADDLRKMAGRFDVIIDSAAGEGFNDLVGLAGQGARIVSYGGGSGKVPDFRLQSVFWKQLHILGTSMGSDAEFAAMVDFVERRQLRPVIDCEVPLMQGREAFDRMAEGLQFGKIVLNIGR